MICSQPLLSSLIHPDNVNILNLLCHNWSVSPVRYDSDFCHIFLLLCKPKMCFQTQILFMTCKLILPEPWKFAENSADTRYKVKHLKLYAI